MRTNVRYSESFKMKVVSELETGKWTGCHAASTAYGIKGMATVSGWVAKYGKNHLLRKVVRVETMDEKNALKEAQKRIKLLEHMVSDMKVDLALEKSFLLLACEAAGETKVDEFKKKHACRLPEWLLNTTKE